MTPEVERFLDLATRPLEASPGDREEAKGELMSRMAHGGVPYEMLDLDEPLGRLEGAKPAKTGLRRSLLASGAFLLTAAVVAVTAFLVWEILLMSQAGFIANRYSYGALGPGSEAVLKHARSVAPALPLGLHSIAGSSRETLEALEKTPEDLAMLQEHIVRHVRAETGWISYTTEEQEIIARLDPDNALWSLIRIAPLLSKATRSPSAGGHYYGIGSTITSEPEFQEALRLFSEAALKPAYFDRSDSLKRRQLDAFPPARTLSEFMIATGFSGMASPPLNYSGSLGTLAKLHTTRLIAAGDRGGLVIFYLQWSQLSKTVVGSPESGETDYSGTFYQLVEVGRWLREAFDKLGMAAESADTVRQINVLERLTTSPLTLPKEITDTAGLRLESEGRLPINLTLEEALPSRRVELSFFDRIVATSFSSLALVFAGLVAFETCRRSRIVKGMARGMMPLFRGEDHAWIAALGIALPWLWWWVITRMSPLGWREGGFEEPWPTLVWTLQFSAGLVFAAVMLLQTARWRWGIRGGFLGLGVSLSWIGWGVAAVVALAIPVAGSLRYFVDSLSNDESGYFLLGVTGMVACGGLWLLWQGVMTLFTPRSGALRPNLAMRVTLPWAMTGVATLLASVVISAMVERHWFAKDPLFPASTSRTHVNALKERVAKEIREAARDL
jgi:hypothetical protein